MRAGVPVFGPRPDQQSHWRKQTALPWSLAGACFGLGVVVIYISKGSVLAACGGSLPSTQPPPRALGASPPRAVSSLPSLRVRLPRGTAGPGGAGSAPRGRCWGGHGPQGGLHSQPVGGGRGRAAEAGKPVPFAPSGRLLWVPRLPPPPGHMTRPLLSPASGRAGHMSPAERRTARRPRPARRRQERIRPRQARRVTKKKIRAESSFF
ncbi:unnamed protein product [Eretmochelys imbricata]